MKKHIYRICLVLVLLLSAAFLVACGGGQTATEKVLACNVEGCSQASVETTISVDSTVLYKETSKYVTSQNGYNKITDIEKILGLDEEGDENSHSETEVSNIYSVELKEEYLEEIECDGTILKAKISASGLAYLGIDSATNATIEVKTENGKVTEVNINYVNDGQNVKILAKYEY